jgi:hypothetical protein
MVNIDGNWRRGVSNCRYVMMCCAVTVALSFQHGVVHRACLSSRTVQPRRQDPTTSAVHNGWYRHSRFFRAHRGVRMFQVQAVSGRYRCTAGPCGNHQLLVGQTAGPISTRSQRPTRIKGDPGCLAKTDPAIQKAIVQIKDL